MQLAPEVSEGLGLGGLGPEQARDELPGLRAARMGGQVRDEGYGAGRPGRRAGAVVGDDLLPQEGHVQHFDTASWPQGKRNVMPGASPKPSHEGKHGGTTARRAASKGRSFQPRRGMIAMAGRGGYRGLMAGFAAGAAALALLTAGCSGAGSAGHDHGTVVGHLDIPFAPAHARGRAEVVP